MAKLSDPHATIVREQVKRIHAAVNDGTIDRDTVSDALTKLTDLADAKNEPKHEPAPASMPAPPKTKPVDHSNLNV